MQSAHGFGRSFPKTIERRNECAIRNVGFGEKSLRSRRDREAVEPRRGGTGRRGAKPRMTVICSPYTRAERPRRAGAGDARVYSRRAPT
jgi:hypothetical protein